MIGIVWSWLKRKMTDSIGEKLRLARETRGIALRDISDQTRISMRYLEAIEADDYARLPGGIFNRSFIRAYAKFIGYDEKEAIDEYAREQESIVDAATTPYKSLVYTNGGGNGRSPLLTLLLAIIILAVLSLCVWAGLHFYQRSVAPKPQPSRTGRRVAPGTEGMRNDHAIRFATAKNDLKEDAHEFSA